MCPIETALSLGIIFLIFHIRTTANKKLKITNIVCNSSNDYYLKFEKCIIKAVNRSFNYISVEVNINEVNVKKIATTFESVKRAFGWKPWLYRFTVKVCEFVSGQRQKIIQFGLSLVSAEFDFVENCNAPNRTHFAANITNVSIIKAIGPLPVPTGEYGVLTVSTTKNLNFTIDVYARWEL